MSGILAILLVQIAAKLNRWSEKLFNKAVMLVIEAAPQPKVETPPNSPTEPEAPPEPPNP